MERRPVLPAEREKAKALEMNTLEIPKTSGMRSALVLLVRLTFFLFFVLTLACDASTNFAGRWQGRVQIPEHVVDLIVDLDQTNGNDWVGSIIIPGLGVKGAPLTRIAISESAVSCTIKDALASERTGSAVLKASLTTDGQLSGEFVQAGNSAPFVLRKTGPPEVELPRRSTAVSEGLAGEWKGDYEMNGYPRHVTLRLANHNAGGATAELVVVGKRTTNAPVDLVVEEDGFLTIESHEIGITYAGLFRKEAGEIKGTCTLGPFEAPLTLRRTL